MVRMEHRELVVQQEHKVGQELKVLVVRLELREIMVRQEHKARLEVKV